MALSKLKNIDGNGNLISQAGSNKSMFEEAFEMADATISGTTRQITKADIFGPAQNGLLTKFKQIDTTNGGDGKISKPNMTPHLLITI